MAGGTAISATKGGTVSSLTGGKFANGARTAAFQYLFNQAAGNWWKEQKAKWAAAKKINAFDTEMSRLKDLFTNDQKALFLEFQVLHGFEGKITDLSLAYISLQTDLVVHRTYALLTAASGLEPAIVPSFTRGAMTPEIGSVINMWPFLALASTPPYTTSYSCHSLTCSVEEFSIVK
jgi:hypothetical protein